MADSRTGSFFEGSNFQEVQKPSLGMFFDNLSTGFSHGQNIPHEPPTVGTLNHAQFETVPPMPSAASQRRPKAPTATETHSGRYNSRVAAALSSGPSGYRGYDD